MVDHPTFRITGAKAGDTQSRGHKFPRWRKMILRKKGTPTSEVTIPTGISVPGTIFLDATDAIDKTSAPSSALAGR